MKKINEMTEQEILALSEKDIQNMIKFRMMEEGIKIVDKPKNPELFEIEPADLKVYNIPILDNYAFMDFAEAQRVSEALKNAKSFRKVDYDWNKLGSQYKYLEKKERYTYNNLDDFGVNEIHVYSNGLYANIVDFAAQNKAMSKQAEADMKAYNDAYAAASDITIEIRNRITEVREKTERLERLTRKFANDYYPLSDNNEKMAIKFMSKAFSLGEDEQKHILANYKELLQEGN
jgi:hypothetical protein